MLDGCGRGAWGTLTMRTLAIGQTSPTYGAHQFRAKSDDS